MVTPVALKVMLPHSEHGREGDYQKNIMLVVTADRQYFIDDRKVEFMEIEPALASMVKNKKEECGDRVCRLAAGRHVAEPTAGRRSDRYSEQASVEDVAVC
ncbi:MAG: ExbD/TolR family protein [Alistipes sp.]